MLLKYKDELVDNGYCVIPELVSTELVQQALCEINSELFYTRCSDYRRDYSLMEEVGFRKEILSLFYETEINSLVSELLGNDCDFEVDRGQIALEFPSKGLERSVWHIDGFFDSKCGYVDNPVNFPIIVGVFLSDVENPSFGNLMIHSKGFLEISRYAKEHGCKKSVELYKGNEVAAKPILAKSGSVVLMHYLAPHYVSRNLSHKIRYAAYFRPYIESRKLFEEKIFYDPLLEWVGVR